MDRFWDKVNAGRPDDCWEWTGGRHPAGYGVFWHSGKNIRANRMALILTVGAPPSRDAMALHSCDNPPCCNPAHLRWGSAMDNHDDRVMRKGPMHGEKSAVATITDEIASSIMRMRIEGLGIPGIARRLGLSETLVENVYTGSSWSHLHGVDGNPTLAQLKAARSRVRRKAANRILTDAMVDGIFAARMRGEGIEEISARLGVPKGTISPVFCGLAFAERLGKHGNPTFEELRSVRAAPKNHKLTEDDIVEIRSLLGQGYLGMDIAKRYGVSKATISNIKRGLR